EVDAAPLLELRDQRVGEPGEERVLRVHQVVDAYLEERSVRRPQLGVERDPVRREHVRAAAPGVLDQPLLGGVSAAAAADEGEKSDRERERPHAAEYRIVT